MKLVNAHFELACIPVFSAARAACMQAFRWIVAAAGEDWQNHIIQENGNFTVMKETIGTKCMHEVGFDFFIKFL